jgi:hypothetical protein
LDGKVLLSYILPLSKFLVFVSNFQWPMKKYFSGRSMDKGLSARPLVFLQVLLSDVAPEDNARPNGLMYIEKS